MEFIESQLAVFVSSTVLEAPHYLKPLRAEEEMFTLSFVPDTWRKTKSLDVFPHCYMEMFHANPCHDSYVYTAPSGFDWTLSDPSNDILSF